MDNAAQVPTVASGVNTAVAQAQPVSSSVRALTSAVSEAVRTLNESGVVGDGREVTFSLDRATRIPIVKVLDTSTKEVISQWPPEYAIRLAEISQSRREIHDESVLRTDGVVGESG